MRELELIVQAWIEYTDDNRRLRMFRSWRSRRQLMNS